MQTSRSRSGMRAALGACCAQAAVLVRKGFVVFFGVFLYFMYLMTLGEKMLPDAPLGAGLEGRVLRMFLFASSSVASQLVFAVVSSHKAGILTSPISEAFLGTRGLVAALAEQVREKEVVPTCLAALNLSSLLTSLGFFALRVFRADRVLLRTPRHVSDALFVVVGLLGAVFANERVPSIDTGLGPNATRCAYSAVGLVLYGTCAWAGKRSLFIRRNTMLLIPGVALSVFYAAVLWTGASAEQLQRAGWFRDAPGTPLVLPRLDALFGRVDFWALARSTHRILGIAAVNLAQFPINYIPRMRETKQNLRVQKDLAANAVANLASACLCTSTYVLPSSTIAVFAAGSRSRSDTVLIGVGFAAACLSAYRHILYVPFVVFDLVLLCLSLRIVVETGISAGRRGWMHLGFVVLVGAASLGLQSVLGGVFAAALLHVCFCFLRRRIQDGAGKAKKRMAQSVRACSALARRGSP